MLESHSKEDCQGTAYKIGSQLQGELVQLFWNPATLFTDSAGQPSSYAMNHQPLSNALKIPFCLPLVLLPALVRDRREKSKRKAMGGISRTQKSNSTARNNCPSERANGVDLWEGRSSVCVGGSLGTILKLDLWVMQ